MTRPSIPAEIFVICSAGNKHISLTSLSLQLCPFAPSHTESPSASISPASNRTEPYRSTATQGRTHLLTQLYPRATFPRVHKWNSIDACHIFETRCLCMMTRLQMIRESSTCGCIAALHREGMRMCAYVKRATWPRRSGGVDESRCKIRECIAFLYGSCRFVTASRESWLQRLW